MNTHQTPDSQHIPPAAPGNVPSAQQLPIAQNAAGAIFQAPPLQPAGPEENLWAGRTSFRHFAGSIFIWLLINIGIAIGLIYFIRSSNKLGWPGGILIFLIAVFITSMLLLSRAMGRVFGRHYRLTSQRLFIEKGIFGTTTDQMELTRVEDIRVQKSFMDRILRVGTVDLLTTDVTDRSVIIEGVGDSDTVAELIRARMRNLRGRSVFVEDLNPAARSS